MTCRLIGNHATLFATSAATETEYSAIQKGTGSTLDIASVTTSRFMAHQTQALRANTGGTVTTAYADMDWGVDSQTIYTLFYVNFTSVPSAVTALATVCDSGSNPLVTIRVNASGFWQVNNIANSTVYTSTLWKPVATTWHSVELYWKQDTSAGEFTVKIDHVADADLTQTGLNNDTAQPRRIRFGVTESQANAGDRFFGPYIVNDSAGSVNNSWVGRALVARLYLDGQDTANWTVVDSGKVDYQCLVELPWNSNATDMIKSSVSGEININTLSSFGSDSAAISFIALQAMIRQRRGTSGSAASVDVVLRSGSSDGTPTTCDSGSTTFKTFRGAIEELDPATSSAWTLSGVNGVKIKLTHQANTNECDVNAALVYVAFNGYDAALPTSGSSGLWTRGSVLNAFKVGSVNVEREPRRGRTRHKVTF